MKKPKVKEISERMWEIPELGKTITLKTKQGRRIWTCSCQNHSRYCNEQPFCYHIQLVTEYLATKPILNKIEELLEEYNKYKTIDAPMDAKAFINDLENLKKIVTEK